MCPPRASSSKKSSKLSKTTHGKARETPIGHPNLRSRSGTTASTHNNHDHEEHDTDHNNTIEAHIDEENEDNNQTQGKKPNGRKYIRKEDFWVKERRELIKLQFNEYDQPVGEDAKELPSVIGMLVRTKSFPLGCDDWRQVNADQK
uniref:Uncharacterized protein n=1 Tax=Arundo donax TaxID=35708 RepID=A0A0A8YEQ8_ARUDO